MKKILCVLLATLATASFAAEKDCSKWTANDASKIAGKVQGKGVKGLTINYSSDFATQATAFQSALQEKGINVTMAQVSGTGKCEFTNFSK